MAMTCVCFNTGMATWWPPKYPYSVLDYTLDITSSVDVINDVIASVACSIAPSGLSELIATDLQFSTPIVVGQKKMFLTVTLSGGQPGRIYRIRFIVTMTDGRIFEFIVMQELVPELPAQFPTTPPSRGFGTPITNP